MCVFNLKKADTFDQNKHFFIQEREYVIFPLLFSEIVPSFSFLFFESKKPNPHTKLISIDATEDRLGFTFLESHLHCQHAKTQQLTGLLSSPTHHSKIQVRISTFTFLLQSQISKDMAFDMSVQKTLLDGSVRIF